jgi:hypothetical protein
MNYTNGYNSGKPDVTWWLDQVRKGVEWRKKVTHQASWDRWRKYYRGEFPKGVLPVNLYFRMLRSIVPQVYFRNPSLSVMASKPGMEQQLFAQLIERIDNKLIRTMGVKQAMKRATQMTWMFGTGALKLGYGAEFTPSPEMFDTSAPEHMQTRMTRYVEYNSQVAANMPWLMSVHPGNLIVPMGLSVYEDTPWVGMWIKRSLDDVKSDPRLKNTSDLVSSSNKGISSLRENKTNENPDEIDLIELRDRRTRKVLLIAPFTSERVLYFGDDELQNNNRPNIYPTIFNPDDEYFWGVPDAHILESQQDEINEIRTLTMKHRRISLLKLLYKKGAIDHAEVEKLLNGDVLAAVQVTGELSDIDTLQIGDIPNALFDADQQIQQEVRDLMGFSRNQAGEYQSNKSHNAPTAAEARIVQAASGIRVDERRDILADALVDIFEDTNQLIFSKWSDEEVVQVMGPEGIPLWVQFKPAMLQAAKYELTVEPDSMLPETKDMRQQKAVQVYGLFKDNPLIDPQLLTKYLLREMHGVQYDQMMRQMYANAAAGLPGSSPDMPMGPEQLMQMMIQSKNRGPVG